jgi:tetratricopeptide (TPR) repeat protein
MQRVMAAVLLGTAVWSGCARAPVAAVPQPPNVTARLEAAEQLVHLGCLDCLVEAFDEFDRLRADDLVGHRAALAAVRAAALVALRERELGLMDRGYLARARALIEATPDVPGSLVDLIDVADGLPVGPAGSRQLDANDRRVLLQVSREWLESPAPPLGLASHDELFGYIWLALACDPINARSVRPDQALAGIGEMRHQPLMVFKFAAACNRTAGEALATLLAEQPRFTEINYLVGLAALGGQLRPGPPGRPDLDEADARLRAAYAWRSDWPGLTLTLGNIAATAEDFEAALELYDRTLELVPGQPDALLGRVRCLTYLNRHTEALTVADELLAGGQYPGDVRYWRALNQVHLTRYEEAWADIELASTLVVNADVPKLAGVIAIHRSEMDLARRKLEEARGRRPTDCEIGFYLQTVLSEQRAWRDAADMAGGAGACFDQDEERLRQEIADLRASQMPPQRLERLVAARAQQIEANAGMRAACWFNAAAAHFNLGAGEEARVFAEKVVEDDRFGARARNLLSRLTNR